MPRATSSPSTPRRSSLSGIFKWEEPSTQALWPTRSTERSTWQSRPETRFTPSACHEKVTLAVWHSEARLYRARNLLSAGSATEEGKLRNSARHTRSRLKQPSHSRLRDNRQLILSALDLAQRYLFVPISHRARHGLSQVRVNLSSPRLRKNPTDRKS